MEIQFCFKRMLYYFFLILFFLFGFLFLYLNWWSQCRLACSYIRHHLWQITSLRGPWNWCPYVGYCYWLLKLLSYTFLWKPSKYDTFRTRRHKFVSSHCPQKTPALSLVCNGKFLLQGQASVPWNVILCPPKNHRSVSVFPWNICYLLWWWHITVEIWINLHEITQGREYITCKFCLDKCGLHYEVD